LADLKTIAQPSPAGKRLLLALIVGLFVFGLDQTTKWLVLKHLVPDQSVPVWGETLRLTLVSNPHLAFGIPLPQAVYFALLGLFLLLALLAAFLHPKSSLRHNLTAFYPTLAGIGLGAAAGNLTDRFRLGAVVDFIDISLSPTLRWPTFNVADIGLTLVVLLLFWQMLKKGRRGPNL
jgi:signal peptidase II